MSPHTPLPLPPKFSDVDSYLDSLFTFCSNSAIWAQLCGGVHILDFFTRDPDLYAWLLPQEWREWFDVHELDDILDFLLREDLAVFERSDSIHWRGHPPPPSTLLEYVRSVRDLLLDRSFTPTSEVPTLPKHVSVGMIVKKVHEVSNFSNYITSLSTSISSSTQQREITHLVDFGSGQNYLGRALACPPYQQHVIAVESKKSNIEGSRRMDVHAKLAPKEKRTRMVNKKEWVKEWQALKAEKVRKKLEAAKKEENEDLLDSLQITDAKAADEVDATSIAHRQDESGGHISTLEGSTEKSSSPPSSTGLSKAPSASEAASDVKTSTSSVDGATSGSHAGAVRQTTSGKLIKARLDQAPEGQGSVQYVEHRLQDGNLHAVIDEIVLDPSLPSANDGDAMDSAELPTKLAPNKYKDPSLIVMSIHSCGNLSHHGLRSLALNPNVTAVAIVGCCYNLVTERLTPPSYKHPALRPTQECGASDNGAPPANSPFPYRPPGDPHGYPMSTRLVQHDPAITLNITARMMAVQAPMNWTKEDSDSFFTRHYYRALLQRVFLDRGCVKPPPAVDTDSEYHALGGSTMPVIIGSLRKKCYDNFTSYVRGALGKIVRGEDGSGKDPERARMFKEKMGGMTDEEIKKYDEVYRRRKKEVSIVWSLMAYSAGLVEAIMVVDRWLWLKEQEEVADCWVETVWDYEKSPRNLVVVGIKK